MARHSTAIEQQHEHPLCIPQPWTLSKQENKTKLLALHKHTAFINSDAFLLKLGALVSEGLGPKILELLSLQPDVDQSGMEPWLAHNIAVGSSAPTL